MRMWREARAFIHFGLPALDIGSTCWISRKIILTPEEIIEETSEAGFTDIKLTAVEGFANAYLFENYSNDEYMLTQLLRHIELTEAKPELL